jgi:hypothetical protein
VNCVTRFDAASRTTTVSPVLVSESEPVEAVAIWGQVLLVPELWTMPRSALLT